MLVDPHTDEYSDDMEDAHNLVKVWLARYLLRYAQRGRTPEGEYTDLFVGREELDAYIRGTLGVVSGADDMLYQLEDREDRIRRRMNQRAVENEEYRPLPFEDVRVAFDLDDERLMDLVIALFVVEVYPEAIRAFCHAWCDFSRRHVEIGFLIELVSRTASDRLALAQFFAAGQHPLVQLQAIEIYNPAVNYGLPLMQRAVRLSDRAVQFLCGQREPPIELTGHDGGLYLKPRGRDSLIMSDGTIEAFAGVFRSMLTARPGGRLYLYGPGGSGKRSLCHLVANQLGRALVVFDCGNFPFHREECLRHILACVREARLQNAIPFFVGFDMLWTSRRGEQPHREAQAQAMELASDMVSGPLIFSGERSIHLLGDRLPGLQHFRVPFPTAEEQVQIWRQMLSPQVKLAEGFSLEDIVARYSLNGGAIGRITQQLKSGVGRDSRPTELTPGLVYRVVRDHLVHRLGSLATHIDRGFSWDDLVVPERTRSTLKELVAYVRHRFTALYTWGLGTKAGYGTGVAVLFSGPSGTGKTMAASIIATDLSLEIFQVDLSRIVDKYIGETEKNLSQVFEEGERSKAILLFDEADALFGSRTKVSTSVDRYANLEVNYLLQRIENYDGICILTTNFADAIDEAFKRRIRYKIEFPFPTEKDREQLWRIFIPKEAPLCGTVDYSLLAKRYELSGANIRNIVIRAAVLALEAGAPLSMDIIVQAANREYTEMGKLIQS